MPDFVPIADGASGFVTWQPYSAILKRDVLMSQEDAEQFATDLDQLIADCRSRKETEFQLQIPEQGLGSSHRRLSEGILVPSSPVPTHEVSTKSINLRGSLDKTMPASNDLYLQHSIVMRKGRDMPDPRDLSHGPKKPYMQENAVRKEKKLASYPHNKDWNTTKGILGQQGGKHLTPNQRYQSIVKEYFGDPAKLARLEVFLQGLPSTKSDLEYTKYARASPYEQLFVYSRLTRHAHRNRQSYEEVYRKFLSMRLQLEVEINLDFLKAMVKAGIPLSDEYAAKLQLWTEESQIREGRLALKAHRQAVDEPRETAKRDCQSPGGEHWQQDLPQASSNGRGQEQALRVKTSSNVDKKSSGSIPEHHDEDSL